MHVVDVAQARGRKLFECLYPSRGLYRSQGLNMAHNLEDSKWRSSDVSQETYFENDSNKIEIVPPIQAIYHHGDEREAKQTASGSSSSFQDLKLNPKIVTELNRCGFLRPSPIQSTAIPLGRLGLDLIAQSKSGTGKTLVFLVCVLEMLVETFNEAACPRVLVVAPTREIALQIATVFESLTSCWQPKVSCYQAIGGTKVSENIANLTTSQVVVGTPGRICCLLELDLLKAHSIRLLVLDECDKLMDNKFKIQINKLYGYLPENKQVIVTSATMSEEMTCFLSDYMRSPALVRLNANNPALVGILQTVVYVEGHALDCLNFEAKKAPLASILLDVAFNQCIIFTNYQTRAKYLYEQLVSTNWSVLYISAEMSQSERSQAITNFRNGKYRILVSTDLTSRGIDIDTVNLVVNIDVPIDSETYLHRIGRAGRFGSAGIAISIVSRECGERKRFQAILDQYHLLAHEVTLPITTNLWGMLYQDNEGRVNHLKRYNQALPMNPLFREIQTRYNNGVDHGQTDLAIPSRSSSSSNDKTIDVANFLMSLVDRPVEDMVKSKGKPEAKTKNVIKLEATPLVEVNKSQEIPLVEVNKPQDTTLFEANDSQEMPLIDATKVIETKDDHSRSLISFLRPPVPFSDQQSLESFIQSNVALCKYLLRGGGRDYHHNDNVSH